MIVVEQVIIDGKNCRIVVFFTIINLIDLKNTVVTIRYYKQKQNNNYNALIIKGLF